LPLEQKIILTKERIREFYEFNDGMVYVAFSGGKDSTVLLHLVRSLYPDVPAVFVDTGLEYPEIKEFVKTIDNVITLRPVRGFKEVIETEGFPVVSKRVSMMLRDLKNPTEKNKKVRDGYISGEYSHNLTLPKKWYNLINAPFKISDKCCNIMKKAPFKKYEKEAQRKAFIGTMASDSEARTLTYLQTGCNSFNGKIQSIPLGFWLETDIWKYIGKFDIPYCKIYDTGVLRTGCMFCMFGVHLEGTPNKFQRMAKSHPKQYKFCMEVLKLTEVLDYIGIDWKPIKTLEEFKRLE